MRKMGWGLSLGALLFCTIGVCEVEPKNFTFKWEPPKEVYGKGLLPKSERPIQQEIDDRFLKADVALPQEFDLRTVTQLSPMRNQGSCGSCVYFATTSVFADTLILRGLKFPDSSGALNMFGPQFLLDCAGGMRCNGSYFMLTAPGVVKGMPFEQDYQYQASSRGSCRSATLHGSAVKPVLINNSFKSIATAIFQKSPVAVTVGADSTWSGYRGGVYNGCRNTGTNHEISAYGFRLEGGTFDADGNLPPGVGQFLVRNNWDTTWGDKGWMWTKATDTRGNLCNGLGEEAGIIDVGVTPPPPPSPNVLAAIPFYVYVIIVLSLAIAVLVFFLVRKK